MVEFEDIDSDKRIILSPNRSATWAHTKYLMLVMVFFVMVIAIAWAFVGAWVILPFAGLEVGLLVYIMYRVSKSTYKTEILTISSSEVTLIKGRIPLKKFREIYAFSRDDLHIEIVETDNNWHLPEIQLVTSNNKLCIGAFLNLEDRQKLASYLRSSGLPNCRTHWWKND